MSTSMRSMGKSRSIAAVASVSSCISTAVSARRRLSSTRALSVRMLFFRLLISRCSWVAMRVPRLAESAGDVVLGLFLGGVFEDLRGGPELDDAPLEKEGGVVGHAGGLLHVV